MKNISKQSHILHRLHGFIHLIIMAVFVVVLGFLFTTLQPRFTDAGSGDNVTGWAWSGVNGGGWISLNCTNESTCATTDYGVNIDDTTGNWSGKGWSSNVGWVNFAGGGSCGGGVNTDLATGTTTGWAYVESASGSQLGGFSGCISMSGLAQDGSGYGVQLNTTTGNFSGYAWSGDDVQADIDNDGTNDWVYDGSPDVGLGWIDFQYAQYDEEIIEEIEITTSSSNPSLPFSGTCGDDVMVSWSASGVEDTCSLEVTANGSPISGSPFDIDVSTTSNYTTTATGAMTFVLSCTADDGSLVPVTGSTNVLCDDSVAQCSDGQNNDLDSFGADEDDPSCYQFCTIPSDPLDAAAQFDPNGNYSENRTCVGSAACIEDPSLPGCDVSGGVPPEFIES